MHLVDLAVQNVRGLPDLHLEPDNKNIVIWGPNGAGKSGVVDAIDFAITGRISRLLGEGTAGITLARHGPHIDHDPESAIATAFNLRTLWRVWASWSGPPCTKTSLMNSTART